MADRATNGFVETELGLLPSDWGLSTFADCVEVKNGQVDPRVQPYSEMIHVGPENIEKATGKLLPCVTAAELQLKSGKYHFSPDYVIYSKIRPYLRKAALVNFEGVCSADMYPVRPVDARLHRMFLYFWLLSSPFTSQVISFQRIFPPLLEEGSLQVLS